MTCLHITASATLVTDTMAASINSVGMVENTSDLQCSSIVCLSFCFVPYGVLEYPAAIGVSASTLSFCTFFMQLQTEVLAYI